MRAITGLLALVLVCAACGDDTGDRRFDASDDGTTVSMAAGDRFTIELESNPSTGYSWVLPDDLEIVELVDERWIGDSDLTGSPGISHLEFEVTGTGTWTLDLEYRRPWLPDEPADRTFGITITTG